MTSENSRNEYKFIEKRLIQEQRRMKINITLARIGEMLRIIWVVIESLEKPNG